MTVRIWDKVETAARSGKLASRLSTKMQLDWGAFDGLKRVLLDYLKRYRHQVASHFDENLM